MYFARKAEPKSSKLLYKKKLDEDFRRHRERLRSMKPSIDNKAPRRFKHLERNRKKEQLMEERYAKIEHENRLLLSKMSDIMQTSTLDNVSRSHRFGKSLNRTSRKRELRRITEENQRILRRIQAVRPMYNHWEWEEERAKAEKYLENLSEYKPSISRRRSTMRSAGASLMGSTGALGPAADPMGLGMPEGGEGGAPPPGYGGYGAAGGGGASYDRGYDDGGAGYGAAGGGGAADYGYGGGRSAPVLPAPGAGGGGGYDDEGAGGGYGTYESTSALDRYSGGGGGGGGGDYGYGALDSVEGESDAVGGGAVGYKH